MFFTQTDPRKDMMSYIDSSVATQTEKTGDRLVELHNFVWVELVEEQDEVLQLIVG